MSSFLSKAGSQADSVTSLMMLAFFRKHSILFQNYLEKQTADMEARQIDFPKEMLVGIKAVYIASILQVMKPVGDDKVTESALKAGEERKRQIMLSCVSDVTSMKTVRLFSEFLANRFMLNLDPCPPLQFKIKFKPAFEEQLKFLDPNDRPPLDKLMQDNVINFEHLQLRYQRYLNGIIYQYLHGITRSMQNIYADVQGEVEVVQKWRLEDRELKRRCEDNLENSEKRMRKAEQQRDETMAVCERTLQENERLRQEALKVMDLNALKADQVVGSHLEMSRDLLQQNEKLQKMVETLSAEKKALEEKLNAKGLLGRLFQ
jgi:hypothetical protein